MAITISDLKSTWKGTSNIHSVDPSLDVGRRLREASKISEYRDTDENR